MGVECPSHPSATILRPPRPLFKDVQSLTFGSNLSQGTVGVRIDGGNGHCKQLFHCIILIPATCSWSLARICNLILFSALSTSFLARRFKVKFRRFRRRIRVLFKKSDTRAVLPETHNQERVCIACKKKHVKMKSVVWRCLSASLLVLKGRIQSRERGGRDGNKILMKHLGRGSNAKTALKHR